MRAFAHPAMEKQNRERKLAAPETGLARALRKLCGDTAKPVWGRGLLHGFSIHASAQSDWPNRRTASDDFSGALELRCAVSDAIRRDGYWLAARYPFALAGSSDDRRSLGVPVRERDLVSRRDFGVRLGRRLGTGTFPCSSS